MSARRLGYEAGDLVTIGAGLILAAVALMFRDQLDDPRVPGRFLAVALGVAGVIRLMGRFGSRPLATNLVRAAVLSTAFSIMFLQLHPVLPFVVAGSFWHDLLACALYVPMLLLGVLLLVRRQYSEFNACVAGVALAHGASFLGHFLGLAVSPSCAGAVVVLLATWRWRRTVFWAILPVQAMLVLALVVLGVHSVVAVSAGLLVGVVSWYAGRALNELFQGNPFPRGGA
jgi:hypothetical protein